MANRIWTHVAWMACVALTGTASEAALLPEVTPSGHVSLPYSQRFTAGERLLSTPTFTVSSGLREGLEASLRLALDSDIRPTAMEWEPRLTYMLMSGPAPWRLALAGAYNTAALSADASLIGSYQLGAVTLRGSSSALSNGFGVGGPTGAMGIGIGWRLNDWVSASADYGGVVASWDMEAIANQLPPLGLIQAWRFGVQVGPGAAQPLELYVTNSHTHTLQGLNRGSDHVQVGIEYRLPLWGSSPPDPPVALAPFTAVPDPFAISMASQTLPVTPPIEVVEVPPLWLEPAIAPSVAPRVRRKVAKMAKVAKVLKVRMGAQGYAPAEIRIKRGTVVRWINGDRISHTATSPRLWDSRWKKPGKAFERRFDHMGVFPYQCKRHPHERGIVRVI